jgi:hypothetical protein
MNEFSMCTNTILLQFRPDSNIGRRENCHKICFRHGQLKGNYILIVDGVPQITTGYHPITAREPVRVEFKMGGKECCIIFDGRGNILTYEHQLFIEGNRFPEARESINIAMNEKMPTQIKSIETKKSSAVAFYGFDVLFADGSKSTIYRRYSQFGMLDSLLRAELDFHMVSSLPPLPGKVFNPYFDQMGKAFLAERQAALCSYLSQLLGNSKVHSAIVSFIFHACMVTILIWF